MNRRHLIIVLVVVVIAAIFALTIFSTNNQAPRVDGSANSNEETQSEPAAVPTEEPAETTPATQN